MDKHFGFQDFVQALLVYKAKVGNGSVLICKTIRKNKKISLEKNNANQRKFHVQAQEEEREKGD